MPKTIVLPRRSIVTDRWVRPYVEGVGSATFLSHGYRFLNLLYTDGSVIAYTGSYVQLNPGGNMPDKPLYEVFDAC